MRCFLMIVCVAVLVSSSVAQIPELINYQGILADSAGTPVNGSLSMVFSIYEDSTGGIPIWTETHGSVSVVEGRFNLLLGSVTPLDASVFDESDRYLGLAVSGDPEMQPRARISSTPYTYNAGSVINSSGGSVLLVGSASDTVQVDPYSGYAFRVTNDGGDERLIIEANDEEGSTISIKNPNGRYMTLGSGDSTVCIYGSDGNRRVIIGMEAGDRIDGGGAVSVYDDSSRLAVTVSREGVVLFNGAARADTVAIFSTDGNIIGKGWISMGTDSVNGPWSAVFGQNCSAQDTGATVSGGISNHAHGYASTIGGGRDNYTDSAYATIGGGSSNDAWGKGSTIGGGYANDVDANYGSVGGGYLNDAQGYMSTIAGGSNNVAWDYSVIGGGSWNTAGGERSIVAGGRSNGALGFGGAVGGGQYDTCYARYGGVFSGYHNLAGDEESDTASFVGGGIDNSAISPYSSVVGGELNTATGKYSVISGGYYNTTSGVRSVVGGGWENEASGDNSFIGGGDRNVASGPASTIGGGGQNISSNTASVVAGGVVNIASGMYSAIGGGNYNEATANSSTVGGGSMNLAGAGVATVSGGANNDVYGYSSVIGGGSSNSVEGTYCVVPGGYADTIAADANMSFAFGASVYINSDLRAAFFDSDDYGRFGVNRDDRDGGIIYPVHVGTNTANGNGAYLSAGGTWTNGSSRDFKENFKNINSNELIAKISGLEIASWNYKDSDEKHIGPVAEDFVTLFDVGSIRESDGQREKQYLAASDVAGVALAGVQALLDKIEELEARIAELESRGK